MNGVDPTDPCLIDPYAHADICAQPVPDLKNGVGLTTAQTAALGGVGLFAFLFLLVLVFAIYTCRRAKQEDAERGTDTAGRWKEGSHDVEIKRVPRPAARYTQVPIPAANRMYAPQPQTTNTVHLSASGASKTAGTKSPHPMASRNGYITQGEEKSKARAQLLHDAKVDKRSLRIGQEEKSAAPRRGRGRSVAQPAQPISQPKTKRKPKR